MGWGECGATGGEGRPTDKVSNKLHPVLVVDAFAGSHELAQEHVRQCAAGVVPKPMTDEASREWLEYLMEHSYLASPEGVLQIQRSLAALNLSEEFSRTLLLKMTNTKKEKRAVGSNHLSIPEGMSQGIFKCLSSPL